MLIEYVCECGKGVYRLKYKTPYTSDCRYTWLHPKVFVRISLLVAACLLATGSQAEQSNHWIDEDKFKFTIGTFITNYDTEFRLTSSTLGRGTNISFEDDLGLEESNEVVRLDGHYRFSPRHRLEFSYFDLSRDGKIVTTRPIIIDDTLFREGSALSTKFDYRVLKLAYAYSFWQTEKFDLSASGGLYTFDVDLQVNSTDGKQEDDAGTAPFPMFGLHLDYRFTKAVYFSTSFEYFVIDKDDFEGELTDARIGIEYRPFENIGFGLGYNVATIFAEDTGSDDEFHFEYDGILVYISWNH